MAVVPNLEAPTVQQEPLPGRPYPRVSDEASPGAFGASIATGLERASEDVGEAAAREKIKNDNLRIIDANTQLESFRTSLLYGQPDENGNMTGGAFSLHGMNAINLPGKLLPQYQAYAQQLSSSLTPDQQRIFQTHIAAGQNELNLQLNRYEHEEGDRLAKAVYANGIDQAVNGAAVGYRDQIAIGKSRADIKALVDMQGAREGWPQDEKDRQTHIALDQMHAGVVNRMLLDGSPNTARAYINAHIGEMDPKASESLQRQVYTTEEHQLVMQQKVQKVQSDALSKEGDSLLAQGKLTPAWIESHRNALEANEFRYFYKALSGTEESSTNPQIYADLYLRAANGEDVRDDARSALTTDHSLSRADFTRVVGLVDQTRPGWFKRGNQYLAQTFEPDKLGADYAGKQRMANAIRDWQDWADQNPEATSEQASHEVDEIANHYRIIPQGQIAMMQRAPMYLSGSLTNPVDEQGKPDPMLSATVRRFQAAVKSGDIEGPAAEEEARRIQALRQIYLNQKAAAAKKAAQQ